jgi:hypothetical protein
MIQAAAGTTSAGTDVPEEQPAAVGYVDAAFLEAARVARVIRAKSLLVQLMVAAVGQAALAGASVEEYSLALVRVRAIVPELVVQMVCLGPVKRNATKEQGILAVEDFCVVVEARAALAGTGATRRERAAQVPKCVDVVLPNVPA